MSHQHFHHPYARPVTVAETPTLDKFLRLLHPSQLHVICEIIHILQLLASTSRYKMGWTCFGPTHPKKRRVFWVTCLQKTKNSKGYFKIFIIFSHIYPIILHNIKLYIYTVRYKFDIKILDFLQNVSKNF